MMCKANHAASVTRNMPTYKLMHSREFVEIYGYTLDSSQM
jgi:hypothetical protein